MADSPGVEKGNAAKLTEHCRATLGETEAWGVVAEAPQSVALAVLDAFWSPDGQSDRQTAEQVLALYAQMRDDEWGDAATDGANELIAQFDVAGGPAYFAEQLKKRHPDASSRKAILTAAGSYEACELLRSADLSTPEQLRGATATALRDVERPWKRIAGQRSGESFNRVLLLVEVPTVLPDRPLTGFVTAALGADVDAADVAAGLSVAAAGLGVPVQVLAQRIRTKA